MTGPGGLVLRQTLRYDYPSPVGRLRHQLIVLPPAVHGDQVCVRASLDVRGAEVEVVESADRFGNVAIDVRAARVERFVEFLVDVAVERRGGVRAASAADGLFLEPTSLTEPDAAMRAVAGRLLASGSAGLDLADRVNGWVAGAMRYAHDVTTVRTTAAEALALGQGVCQDYAHVMLALCRLCGLPARYVSGHLVGEGGSHAWVEVLSTAGAVAFDPTNDRRAGLRYMTVAVGRDYADVAPTSGTYSGPPGGGRLTSTKTLEEQPLEATDLVPA